MRRFLSILGALSLAAAMAAGLVFGFVVWNGHRLDASSKAYVDQSVPAIVSEWSEHELLKRASPRLLQRTSHEQLKNLFTLLFDKLGPYKAYEGATGSSMVNFSSAGEVITARYVARASYRYGKVEINLNLIHTQDTWQILGFHVDLESL